MFGSSSNIAYMVGSANAKLDDDYRKSEAGSSSSSSATSSCSTTSSGVASSCTSLTANCFQQQTTQCHNSQRPSHNLDFQLVKIRHVVF